MVLSDVVTCISVSRRKRRDINQLRAPPAPFDIEPDRVDRSFLRDQAVAEPILHRYFFLERELV
jgi:hypothetical protein